MHVDDVVRRRAAHKAADITCCNGRRVIYIFDLRDGGVEYVENGEVNGIYREICEHRVSRFCPTGAYQQ